MLVNQDREQIKYVPRPYQWEAIKTTVANTKNIVFQKLNPANDDDFSSVSSLLEMATWSWKTFTVAKYLDYVIRLRDRYNRRFNKRQFKGLNILVLTNRIDWLDQFRDDLVHWREWSDTKPAFISPEVLSWMRVKTFHSRADNLRDINRKYWSTSEQDEEENFWKRTWKKDTMFFSTFQTAILKRLSDKLPHIDLIKI